MKKLYHIKLKAGALQYTIFISVVIALLIVAFISLTYVQQRLMAKNKHFKNLIELTDRGFLEADLQEVSYNTPTELALSSEQKSELTAIKQHWGIFDIVQLTGSHSKEVFTKTAMLAGYQSKKPALYLQDENQPLVLVGNSKIQGKAYLPQQGVKRGTIAGNSYSNNQLVYGAIEKSSKELPPILNVEVLKKKLGELFLNELNDVEPLEDEMILVNSFSNPTKVLTSSNTVDLIGARLTGNVIVYATHKITVHQSSLLTDIILIAPEIEIKEKVQGNFQAIASKKITVAQGSKLIYPSSLILVEKQQSPSNARKNNAQIFIAKNCEIKGVVAFLTNDKKESYDAHIFIEKDATIYGEVYCNQNIELRGCVNGSIYTRGFVAQQFGSVYKNHIYNGKITSTNLSNKYAGLQFKSTNHKTAKWLYY